ncbi:unnamed protein product, partial [Pylaiella littoralis]
MKTAIFVDISRHSLGLATRRREDLLSACLVVVCAFRPTNCNSPHRVFIGNVRHTYQVCLGMFSIDLRLHSVCRGESCVLSLGAPRSAL